MLQARSQLWELHGMSSVISQEQTTKSPNNFFFCSHSVMLKTTTVYSFFKPLFEITKD